MSKYVILTLCGIAISVALYVLACGIIKLIKRAKRKKHTVAYIHNAKFDPIWLKRYLNDYENVNSHENMMLQYAVKNIKR